MDDNEVETFTELSFSKNESDRNNESAEKKGSISKEIQTGPNRSHIKIKMKYKTGRKKKKEDYMQDENTMIVDSDDNCLHHSFCVVDSLKKKGLKPFKPKGLPWSSGLLLYLPGQRPPHFEKSRQELKEIELKKKKKKKRKLKEEKRIMKRLREGDHKKLCHVLNTSQELMILMRIISMVMEKKKSELKQRFSGVQTEMETIVEEDEEEAKDKEEEEGNDESVDETAEDEEEENEELWDILPENFLESNE